jgi:hypothetical protein
MSPSATKVYGSFRGCFSLDPLYKLALLRITLFPLSKRHPQPSSSAADISSNLGAKRWLSPNATR